MEVEQAVAGRKHSADLRTVAYDEAQNGWGDGFFSIQPGAPAAGYFG